MLATLSKPSEPPPVFTGLTVCRAIIQRPDGKILLVQRSPQDKRGARCWEAPGGKTDLEDGNNHFVSAARETREETGLVVEFTGPFVVCWVQPMSGRNRFYQAWFNHAVPAGGKLEVSQEHTAAVWASIPNAWVLNLTLETRHALERFISLGRLK